MNVARLLIVFSWKLDLSYLVVVVVVRGGGCLLLGSGGAGESP